MENESFIKVFSFNKRKNCFKVKEFENLIDKYHEINSTLVQKDFDNLVKKLKLEKKICPVCDKSFTWRKKWKNNWSSVIYCSERCKRSKNLKSH